MFYCIADDFPCSARLGCRRLTRTDDAENVSHILRVSLNSKCVFVPSGFSVSHVSLLIATPQKSRSSRLSDDPRGAQNSFANESPAVHIPCVIGQISLGALSLAL